MTYAQYGLVEDTDFNGLVSTGTNPLNTIWATGTSSYGYGQSAVATVSNGDSVTAAQWNQLIQAPMSTIASHQGSSLTAVTARSSGGTITYLSGIPTNLATVTSNRLNAVALGSSAATNTTRASQWSAALTFTHTVTFASADAARYFFNSGGQIAISYSHATTSGGGVNLVLNALAAACGTIMLSAPTSGSITIASVSYSGVTKIGGSGSPTTLATNTGYYALTTLNATMFNQVVSSGTYLNTFIQTQARTNGVNLGGHGDAGYVLTFTTLWDEIPNAAGFSEPAASGSTTSVTIRNPSIAYITSPQWSTPSVSGSVTGS